MTLARHGDAPRALRHGLEGVALNVSGWMGKLSGFMLSHGLVQRGEEASLTTSRNGIKGCDNNCLLPFSLLSFNDIKA
jgi:hypothetical protein